jgi:hypothetical protein
MSIFANLFINLIKSQNKNHCNQCNQRNPVLDKIRSHPLRYNSFLLNSFLLNSSYFTSSNSASVTPSAPALGWPSG